MAFIFHVDLTFTSSIYQRKYSYGTMAETVNIITSHLNANANSNSKQEMYISYLH